MSELTWKSALELRDLIATRKVSPVEVVQASLDRLAEVEGDINAFVEVTTDQALAAAKAAEATLMSGAPLGPLGGLPLSVKISLLSKGRG